MLINLIKRYTNYSWIIWFFVCQIFLQPIRIDSQVVDEFDVAEFTFLSNVNESRLHQSEYHVVSINIPSKNASYTMHLSRPPDLFTPEHIGIHKDEVEDYLCMYTGSVTSPDGGTFGMASLSSCFHETALEGLLFLDNEHYQVTPYLQSPGHRYKRAVNKPTKNGRNSKVTIKHKIAKPKTLPSQRHRSDGRRVPDEELKKARRQMIIDQEALDDERDEDDDSEETGIDDMNQILDYNENANEQEPSLETNLQKKTTPNKRRKIKATNRKAKVIELAIFTDDAFYQKWAQRFPQDTVKKINQYVLALVNNMNYIYQQPSLGPKITYRLVNVGIQRNTPTGLEPSTTAEKYLDNFCAFAGKKDKNGARWDHAMMITGLELKDAKGGDNLGIAFTSTMCLRYYSCSVLEYNKGFETTFTAAHELGHSLGMEHDGEEMNAKCDPSKYIMAAIAGPGQINWSPCSNKNVKNFLASGDPRAAVADPSSVPKCLMKRSSTLPGIVYKTGKFPGQIFGVIRQCNQVCDQCTPHINNEAPYNNICQILHCITPYSEIIAAHPALEGTSCGRNGQNMCRNGRCQ